jgi:Fur family zinc uptake transcriptional regulator
MELSDNINELIKNADTYCKRQGAHLTKTRKLVLSVLIHSGKALSAYDLIDLCKKNFNENIRPMSVYRSLDFLDKKRLAHKLKMSNKYVACSQINCEHHHGLPQLLICGSCNQVQEINIKPLAMSELKSGVEEAGFQLINPQVEINGICNNCL